LPATTIDSIRDYWETFASNDTTQKNDDQAVTSPLRLLHILRQNYDMLAIYPAFNLRRILLVQ
jgi:hypothetical protein